MKTIKCVLCDGKYEYKDSIYINIEQIVSMQEFEYTQVISPVLYIKERDYNKKDSYEFNKFKDEQSLQKIQTNISLKNGNLHTVDHTIEYIKEMIKNA